jgi:hypothetical protein
VDVNEYNKKLFPKNLDPNVNNVKSIIRLVIAGDILNIFFIKSIKPNTPPSVTLF